MQKQGWLLLFFHFPNKMLGCALLFAAFCIVGDAQRYAHLGVAQLTCGDNGGVFVVVGCSVTYDDGNNVCPSSHLANCTSSLSVLLGVGTAVQTAVHVTPVPGMFVLYTILYTQVV